MVVELSVTKMESSNPLKRRICPFSDQSVFSQMIRGSKAIYKRKSNKEEEERSMSWFRKKNNEAKPLLKNPNPEVEITPTDLMIASEHDKEKGLTEIEANRRLRQFGPNEIKEKKRQAWKEILMMFWGPMPWMIEFAMVITLVLRDYSDFIIMLFLLLVNAIIGYSESRKAGKAIKALKKAVAPQAKVLRGNEWKSVESRFLVPGDLIQLSMGDVVPADCEILLKSNENPIEIDQSALTGESIAVKKRRGDESYSGSIVRKGHCEAVVVKTGVNTFFGKAAALVESVENQGHFQKVLFRIAKCLIIVSILLVLFIISFVVIRDKAAVNIGELLKFSVILLIAAVPITLQPVCTATLAVGSRKLAKSGAIVSKLTAIEELAGMDVLCSDKTGTLTKNVLTIDNPWINPTKNANAQDVILIAGLASSRQAPDPIENCILKSLDSAQMWSKFEQKEFIPFDPISKRATAFVKGANGVEFRVCKGAPQALFELGCFDENSQILKEKVDQVVKGLAMRGLRSLGVASQNIETGLWSYLGVLPFFDPPRDDSKQTIERAIKMGVEIKMITGDHLDIARETARRIGMDDDIMTSELLRGSEILPNGAKVEEIVETCGGFAQALPDDKFKIVDILQRKGYRVAMTGDGINDTPALKKADIGIAVAGSTEAARAAASIVLTGDGLSPIIEAILRSRKIFQRMKNFICYRINATITILGFSVVGILLLNLEIPAIVLVLLTLMNDGMTLTIAYDKVYPGSRPEKWNLFEIIVVSSTVGIIGIFGVLSLVILAEDGRFPHEVYSTEQIRTLCYLGLSLGGSLSIFVCRNTSFFFMRRPGAVLFLTVFSGMIISTLIAVYWPFQSSLEPIGWSDAGMVWVVCGVCCLVQDILKVLIHKLIMWITHAPPEEPIKEIFFSEVIVDLATTGPAIV